MAYNRGNLLFIIYTEKILFEYESDLRSNEHHCSSSEKKAWIFSIYSQPFIQHLTGLFGTNTVTSTRLACQLSW